MKKPAPTHRGHSVAHRAVPACLLAIIVVGLGMLVWLRRPDVQPAAGPVGSDQTGGAPAAEATSRAADFKPLLGRWLREDGGYQLELKSAEIDSRIEEAYFNPRPIKVSFAAATNDAGTSRIRVELTDVGYPGCVYSLVHDRVNDRLVGTYFQAAVREMFEVMFVRMQ